MHEEFSQEFTLLWIRFAYTREFATFVKPDGVGVIVEWRDVTSILNYAKHVSQRTNSLIYWDTFSIKEVKRELREDEIQLCSSHAVDITLCAINYDHSINRNYEIRSVMSKIKWIPLVGDIDYVWHNGDWFANHVSLSDYDWPFVILMPHGIMQYREISADMWEISSQDLKEHWLLSSYQLTPNAHTHI